MLFQSVEINPRAVKNTMKFADVSKMSELCIAYAARSAINPKK
jgi:hypothetical protein